MNRNQVLEEIEKLKTTARQLTQHLGDLAEPERSALAAILPDLAPLFHPFRTPSMGTGALVEHSHQVYIESELSRLLEENRRQQSLLDAIFAADPSGLAVVAGPELRFVYANPAYRYICPLLGQDPTGQPYEQIWPADEGDGFHLQIQAVLETGRPFQAQEVERKYRDGSRRIFTFQTRRIEWGNEPAALIIFWDTTDLIHSQRRLEQLLEETHHLAEEMQGLFKAMGDAVIIYDTEGIVLHANPALINILGFDPTGRRREEFAGKMINRWPDGREIPLDQLPSLRALRGEMVDREQIQVTNAAGQSFIVQISASLLYTTDQQLAGVVVVWHDITEQERAEQALRENSQALHERAAMLEAVMDVVPAMIWIAHDRDCREMTGNRYGSEFLRMWQGANISKTAPEAALTLQPYRNFKNGREIPANELPMQVAAATGVPARDYEFDLVFSDNLTRTVLGNVEPLRDSDGKPCGAVAAFIDITERIEAEQRAAVQQEWFQTTLSSIGDAVIATDAEGRIRFLNPVAEQLTGWTTAETAGKPIDMVFNIINEQTRQPVVNPVGKVLEHGVIVGLANHTALLTRDGREIPIEDSAAPIKDEIGQTLGVVMVFRDVTEKRRMEQALQESRTLLQTVMQEAQDPIFLKDRDSRILLANPATLKVIGKPADQVMGKNDAEFYDDPEVGRMIMENDQRIMERSQTEVIEERVIYPGEPPESERIFLSTKTPYRNAEGQVIGIVGVARDITDRKQKEKELNQLNRTLRALNKSHQAMMRAGDERLFMQDVCRIITEDCGYAMVWIGLAEHDAARSVRPVAFAGFEEGYLDALHVTWADTERGRGPTGTAIRTGQPSMCRNMLSDPRFAPWREEALKRGYASSLVLPMISMGNTFGAITIYAREPDAFSEDEVNLLGELASDLAYGITAMRVRAAHAEVEQALGESEARYRNLFQGMTEGFALHEIVCDENDTPQDYRFLEINPAFEQLTGLKAEHLKGRLYSQIDQLREDGSRWVEIYGKVALTGEPIHFENYSPGLKRHYEVVAYRPAPRQFAVIFMDVTERKGAEEALRLARETVEKNLTQIEVQRRLIEQREQERQRIARDLHDGPVQMVTGITFNLQSLAMSNQDPQIGLELDEMRQSLQEVINELRAFAQELRPPVLFSFGLRRAIQAHLESFQEKHPEIHTQLEVDWDGDLLPEQASIALFRVYQECLNNILKHAQANHIWVFLSRHKDQVSLVIEDNGAGFVLPENLLLLAREGHLGLVGMRERVDAIGGTMEIDSQPGKGTRIQVHMQIC